jgi:hypothetical protein
MQGTFLLWYRLNNSLIVFMKSNLHEAHEIVASHYFNKPKDQMNSSGTSEAQWVCIMLIFVFLSFAYKYEFLHLPFESRHLNSATLYLRDNGYSFLSSQNKSLRQITGTDLKTSLCFYCSAELNFIWFCFLPLRAVFYSVLCLK